LIYNSQYLRKNKFAGMHGDLEDFV